MKESEPFSIDVAAQDAIQFLQGNGPASSEQITNALKQMGHCPEDDRVFGHVYRYLNKHNRIKFVGYCQRIKGHGTAGGRVWEAA